jgi:hypothetical protein
MTGAGPPWLLSRGGSGQEAMCRSKMRFGPVTYGFLLVRQRAPIR